MTVLNTNSVFNWWNEFAEIVALPWYWGNKRSLSPLTQYPWNRTTFKGELKRKSICKEIARGSAHDQNWYIVLVERYIYLTERYICCVRKYISCNLELFFETNVDISLWGYITKIYISLRIYHQTDISFCWYITKMTKKSRFVEIYQEKIYLLSEKI